MDRTRGLLLGPDSRGRWLLTEGDRIAHFGEWEDGVPPGEDRIDTRGALLEPGRVNAHTHVYSALAPLGMPRPDPAPRDFPDILERIWWRLDRALDADSLRASARLYAAEALLAGTTALIDHHESPAFIDGSLDVLADACQEMGIRAVLCYGATERNGGRDEARAGLAECARFIRSNERPLVRGLVGLHASFTVSDETVREAGALCRELGVPLHVHLAEDGVDNRDAVARGWPGPLERLLALEALPPGSILAHGIHLSREQVRLAAAHELWFVQNPRSNRGNGVGYPSSLAVSRRVALGTDGYPARMADEAGALFAEAAAHGDERPLVEARLTAGHRLVGELFAQGLAPLAAGGAADAVASRDGAVEQVVVGGLPAVRDGALVGNDYQQIRAEAERAARSLWARMAEA